MVNLGKKMELFVDGKIYILNNHKIREKILQENHEQADVGYPGQ